MKSLIKSKPVLGCIAAFTLLFGTMTYRVISRRHARNDPPPPGAVGTAATAVASTGNKAPVAPQKSQPSEGGTPRSTITPSSGWTSVAENAAYLDQYDELDKRAREDQDARGVPLTRRQTAATPSDANHIGVAGSASATADSGASGWSPMRNSLRLQGRPANVSIEHAKVRRDLAAEKSEGESASANSSSAAPIGPRKKPQRFIPFGTVLKCELVFPLDSVTEQMPLVGLVMEPAYNNGALVIPAGTEVHGIARPDRVRNRLFSGDQWVFVFPREAQRINGRQLNVRGLALERSEPDINGMTWGMSDGSYGIEGAVIRTMNAEEIERFVSTFLAAGATGMQSKQSNDRGGETILATPKNAVLEGVSADMRQLSQDIATEISRHGVYVHIPAGHQFYLYPTQVIDADAADISSDIATVK